MRGCDALTPGARRVARLAADGLSNREIAQDLWVTLRTVEGHLTQAYMKLDICSREQLAAALVLPRGSTAVPAEASAPLRTTNATAARLVFSQWA
ncbi:MAG: helix-turn-helix transcriptional regulator [Actinobacteria bacterium]|nr:helix-turn-helix transcriptional regulator [Actinomycetota bacterium]